MSAKTIAAACLVLCGCQVGPRVESYAPANRATGAATTMTVRVDDRDVLWTGELVAVREDDFLVLTEEGLVRIRHSGLREARFEDVRPARIQREGTERQRRSLALVSRYPFGLSGDQLDSLLDALGQERLLEGGR